MTLIADLPPGRLLSQKDIKATQTANNQPILDKPVPKSKLIYNPSTKKFVYKLLRPLTPKPYKYKKTKSSAKCKDTNEANVKKIIDEIQNAPKSEPTRKLFSPKLSVSDRLSLTSKTSTLPKKVNEKVKKLVDEIAPCYEPEEIETFKKLLNTTKLPKLKITEKGKSIEKQS